MQLNNVTVNEAEYWEKTLTSFSSLLWKERACDLSRRAVFYIVAYNTFTIITKFKVLGEKKRKWTWTEKPQWKAAETRRQNNFENLEMLQSEAFQIFCIVYSSILFTAHNNLADVMLTTNTFA